MFSRQKQHDLPCREMVLTDKSTISGSGSKLNRGGKPQVLVHVSRATHFGIPVFEPQLYLWFTVPPRDSYGFAGRA